jgi:hypothetical protein
MNGANLTNLLQKILLLLEVLLLWGGQIYILSAKDGAKLRKRSRLATPCDTSGTRESSLIIVIITILCCTIVHI